MHHPDKHKKSPPIRKMQEIFIVYNDHDNSTQTSHSMVCGTKTGTENATIYGKKYSKCTFLRPFWCEKVVRKIIFLKTTVKYG